MTATTDWSRPTVNKAPEAPAKGKTNDLQELKEEVLKLELATPPTADPRETLRRVVELIERHQSE